MNLINADADNDGRSTSPPVGTWDFCQAKFYQAYATSDRIEGRCTLIIFWKTTTRKKEFTEYTYLLHFNHEGIKEQKIRKVSKPLQLSQGDNAGLNYIRLTCSEAAALLQDAYQQNIRYNKAAAERQGYDSYLLSQNTSALNRESLYEKFLLQRYGPRAITNIYLAALRRGDYSLQFDLSSTRRRTLLGDRDKFILTNQSEYYDCTCLKSGITAITKEEGMIKLLAYVIFSTTTEEMVKVNLQIMLIKQQGQYFVDDFAALSREVISDEHPDNPLNYPVFCCFYSRCNRDAVKEWLEGEPNYFLTGEIKDSSCYKELKEYINSWQDYSIADRISSEFILKPDKLIVFAKKPTDLAKAEKTVAYYLDSCKRHIKYYLPIRELYRAVFADGGACLEGSIVKYRADSALIYVNSYELINMFWPTRPEARISLGAEACYGYFQKVGLPPNAVQENAIQENIVQENAVQENKAQENIVQDEGALNVNTGRTFVEYYLSGHWLRVNVFGGKAAGVIESLSTGIKTKRIIYDYEWEEHAHISAERKWEIYSVFASLNKENNLIRHIGLVPAFKDITAEMGAVAKRLTDC